MAQWRAQDGAIEEAEADVMPDLPLGRDGIFETARLSGGQVVFWPDHWARFTAGCVECGFQPPADERRVRSLVDELVARTRLSDGVARWSAYRQGSAVRWEIDVSCPRPHMRRGSFRVSWAPALSDSADKRAIKHLRRVEWMAALREARRAGYDETLVGDAQGRVLEGAISNVFFVKDGVVRTPALALGPLPGVMRARVLQLIRRIGLPLEEGVFDRAAVTEASELWLTNALVGIRPVVWLEPQALPPSESWPTLSRIRQAWTTEYGWDPVAVV